MAAASRTVGALAIELSEASARRTVACRSWRRVTVVLSWLHAEVVFARVKHVYEAGRDLGSHRGKLSVTIAGQRQIWRISVHFSIVIGTFADLLINGTPHRRQTNDYASALIDFEIDTWSAFEAFNTAILATMGKSGGALTRYWRRYWAPIRLRCGTHDKAFMGSGIWRSTLFEAARRA